MRTRIVCTAGGMAVLLVAGSVLRAAGDPPPATGAESHSAADAQCVEQAAADAAAPHREQCSVQEDERHVAEAIAEGPPGKIVPRPLRYGVFRWTSYPAAWTAAQKTNRPILMYVTSPSCPHCVKMIAETYQAPHISPLVAESFETVYVDRAVQPELVAKLKVRWFPTTIVVGTNNKVIDVLEGYVDPLAFSNRIKTGLAASTLATQTR